MTDDNYDKKHVNGVKKTLNDRIDDLCRSFDKYIEQNERKFDEIYSKLSHGSQKMAIQDYQIENLENATKASVKANKELMDKLDVLTNDIKDEMRQMSNKMIEGKPGWNVTALITALFSLCVGLIVYVVTSL